jgi:hypothetical protein
MFEYLVGKDLRRNSRKLGSCSKRGEGNVRSGLVDLRTQTSLQPRSLGFYCLDLNFEIWQRISDSRLRTLKVNQVRSTVQGSVPQLKTDPIVYQFPKRGFLLNGQESLRTMDQIRQHAVTMEMRIFKVHRDHYLAPNGQSGSDKPLLVLVNPDYASNTMECGQGL